VADLAEGMHIEHEPELPPEPRYYEPARPAPQPAAGQTSPRAPSIRQAVFHKETAAAGQHPGQAPAPGETAPAATFKTLRDRLIQRQQR
jgi:hypothetical protein